MFANMYIYIYIYIYIYVYKDFAMTQEIGVKSRLSHTKDSKMVLDGSLLNTQNYKIWIKGKVDQSRKRSSAPLLPYPLVS